MMRGAGFLLGSLLMVAVFLLALDTGLSPTLVKAVVSNEADRLEQSEVPEIPEGHASGEAGEPAATVDAPVEPAVDTAALPVADPAGPDAADPADPDAADPPDAGTSGLQLDPQQWNQSMVAFETADHSESTSVSRYLVWSPFKSEWAAQGFARRLVQATGVPVEVVNAEPGNYQVVFSYRDDGERRAMVERIETVTGLELE